MFKKKNEIKKHEEPMEVVEFDPTHPSVIIDNALHNIPIIFDDIINMGSGESGIPAFLNMFDEGVPENLRYVSRSVRSEHRQNTIENVRDYIKFESMNYYYHVVERLAKNCAEIGMELEMPLIPTDSEEFVDMNSQLDMAWAVFNNATADNILDADYMALYASVHLLSNAQRSIVIIYKNIAEQLRNSIYNNMYIDTMSDDLCAVQIPCKDEVYGMALVALYNAIKESSNLYFNQLSRIANIVVLDNTESLFMLPKKRDYSVKNSGSTKIKNIMDTE